MQESLNLRNFWKIYDKKIIRDIFIWLIVSIHRYLYILPRILESLAL